MQEITWANYRRLVAKLARRSANALHAQGVVEPDFDDLMQEGALIFERARANFDPSRNVQFSTYLWRSVAHRFAKLAKGATERRFSSLDEQTGEDGGSALHERIASNDPSALEVMERRATAHETLSRLSPSARRIVECIVAPPKPLLDELARARAFARVAAAKGETVLRPVLNHAFILHALGLPRRESATIAQEINALLKKASR